MGCHPLGKKKTLRIQKQQDKQKPDGLLKKKGSENADWSNGEAVNKAKQVVVSSQDFDDPEK